jgi:hypothetical protein
MMISRHMQFSAGTRSNLVRIGAVTVPAVFLTRSGCSVHNSAERNGTATALFSISNENV